MAMGREGDRQGDLIMTWTEMPRSPGHVFYDRLQDVLIAGDFDQLVETACQPYDAPKLGAPSVPPGRYFRMHMGGYFERLIGHDDFFPSVSAGRRAFSSSARNAISAGVEGRPRIALRWGNRPKRSMTSRYGRP